MANPQKENGFIPIANEIAEKLARYRISGQEYQVLWVVFRKTWGWHKKEDYISLSQVQEMTEMSRKDVVRAIKKLVAKRVLIRDKGGFINSYNFNKNYELWETSTHRGSTNTGSTQKATKVVPKMPPKLVAKRVHTKETKETITKDTTAATAASEVFSLLKEIERLEESPRRDLNIIAFYFRERRPRFENKAQFGVALRRHLRAAKQLEPFTDAQITKAGAQAEEKWADWTLDSIIKILTK